MSAEGIRTADMRIFSVCVALFAFSGLGFADSDETPIGLQRYETGDWSGTVEAFEPVLASDPVNETALFYTGKAILQQERFEQAIPYFERLTTAYPDTADYWMWLGRAAGLSASEASVFRAKRFVNVLKEAFGRALEIEPFHGPTQVALVQFYAEAPFIVGGSMRRARAHAEAAAEGSEAYGDMAWGIYYTYERDYDKALEHLTAATDAGIGEGMAYVFLGRTYAALGDEEKAVAAYERTFEQDDGASFARAELAGLRGER